MNGITIRAFVALACACLAWVGVYFFAQVIAHDQTTRAQLVAKSQENSLRQAGLARVQSLLTDTANERQALAEIFPQDAFSVAGLVTEAGKASNVALKVSNANPEGDAGNGLSTVGLTVQAQGTFESLMHALKILEALPVPSMVQHFDINRVDA